MKKRCKVCENCSKIVPKKVYCVPECPECTPCEQLYLSNCIIFENDDTEDSGNDGLACFGVDSGASVTDLLLKLLEKLFPECHTTTSTTSTSTTSTTTVIPTTTLQPTTTTTCIETITTTQYSICDICP